MLYDVSKASLFGLNNEFISAGRLDDLSMVHAAITAITEAKDKCIFEDCNNILMDKVIVNGEEVKLDL